jgi:hypothetical protein
MVIGTATKLVLSVPQNGEPLVVSQKQGMEDKASNAVQQ